MFINRILLTTILSLIHLQMAYAVEFTHFKLKGSLQDRNMGIKSRFASSAKSNTAVEYPPLLLEIAELLGDKYEEIGKKETDELIKNHQLGGGVLNFSGFSWYKPMGNYNITANREVAPELFSDRWIVHDTFTIYIEASTLLTNFRDQDLIEITNEAIGAFAGLTFQRVYHYYHFADTYLDGLTADFSKLFLSFTRFNGKNVLGISPYEALKKNDSFSFNAGGLVKMPIGNGLDLEGGALMQTSYASEVMIQGVGPDEVSKPDEFLRLSVEKTYNKEAAAQISLQYDFFNLLKLSLLSFELGYDFTKSHKAYLTFYESDKDLIKNSSSHAREFKNIIQGSDVVEQWEQNVTSLEDRIKENLSSKYSFLLFGNMKKRATEQVRIIKNGVEKVFFKHYGESVKYIQSLVSRIFGTLIRKIFDFSTKIQNRAELKKQLKIEYEKVRDLNVATVENTGQFSVQIKYYFQVARTDKWYNRILHKSAQSYTKRLTNLNTNIVDKIKNKELKAPISINSTMEIEEHGLSYFNRLPVETVERQLRKVCNIKENEKIWKLVDNRRVQVEDPKIGTCYEPLKSKYYQYIDYLDSYSKINLNLFKKFLSSYFSKVKSVAAFHPLFGQENIFTHGDFRAKTKEGKNFQTFFKSGQFRGLGVINKFKRTEMTTPIVAR